MIQSMFEPGLSQVWASILGFEGAEFYLQHHPSLDNHTFEEACYSFEAATVIGVLRSDTKEVYMNPPGSYVLKNKDEIIVIAEVLYSHHSCLHAFVAWCSCERSTALSCMLLLAFLRPRTSALSRSG